MKSMLHGLSIIIKIPGEYSFLCSLREFLSIARFTLILPHQ